MSKNTVTVNLEKLKNTCFVVMPFNTLFQREYESIIKPTIEELNITCIRGDEIYAKQRIMDDIWDSIRSCRFVLAEMTGKNPNVLYEIGLAHAIGKPVIIITRNGDDVPFDLKDLRYLFYDVNDPFWGENLKKGITTMAQKVIENPNIDSYLDNITKSDSHSFPDIKTKREKKKEDPIYHDISGSWIGSFNPGLYHGVVLDITQNGNNLSANAIITIEERGKKDIVQQVMAGTVLKNKAVLKGVNYSFVKRERLKDYILDSFEISDFGENLLIGKMTDEQDLDGEIRLTRNES